MRNIFLLIFTASFFWILGSANASEGDKYGVFFSGGFHYIPYMVDSGMNYIIDNYNNNQPNLTQKLNYMTTFYGYSLGIGYLLYSDNQFFGMEGRYSGFLSQSTTAMSGVTNLLELKESQSLLSLDLS